KALQRHVGNRSKALNPPAPGKPNVNKAKKESEKVGRKGADVLMMGGKTVPSRFNPSKAKKIYDGSRKGQGEGDLDKVYKEGDTYYVVEAKGGVDAPLHARTITNVPGEIGK